MKESKQKNTSRFDNAVRFYSGLTVIGSGVFFIPSIHWIFTPFIWLVIVASTYLDKAYLKVLSKSKVKLSVFLSLVSGFILLPPIVVLFTGIPSNFFIVTLTIVGGGLTGVFVFYTYEQ